jgi:hypothetical protein
VYVLAPRDLGRELRIRRFVDDLDRSALGGGIGRLGLGVAEQLQHLVDLREPQILRRVVVRVEGHVLGRVAVRDLLDTAIGRRRAAIGGRGRGSAPEGAKTQEQPCGEAELP